MAAKQVKCPYCGKPALFSPENPFRPFCSERCKLIDLGAWAEEKYAIPVKPAVDIDADHPADQPGEAAEDQTSGETDEFGRPLHGFPVPGQRSKE